MQFTIDLKDNLYKKISIEYTDLIKQEVLKQCVHMDVGTLKIPLMGELYDKVNEQFISRNLSCVKYLYVFKRRNVGVNPEPCHVDCREKSPDNMTNSSIVIPVSGCKNTAQYWMDGEYKLHKQTLKPGVQYFKLEWVGDIKLIGLVEIYDSPVLCRVNIPHHAYANGVEDRITCTMRLENNEPFEEIYEKLSKPR